MKKIIFFIFMFLSLSIYVKADSINKITMDIYLDKYGNAHITEKWDVDINEGTEGYKPYYNLGNSIIKDFTVSDQSNNLYSYQEHWNTTANFESKAYRNGINYITDGIELCWGISNYGHNVYTLKYTITGFVSQTVDKQMIFWTLIPHELSLKPRDVNIVIWADDYFEDTVPVWGYGNRGEAYVYDGKIELNTINGLESYEHMTVLVEFPENKFQTNNILDKTFEEYHDLAEIGSKSYNKVPFILQLINFLFSILPIISLGFIFSAIIKMSKDKYYKKNISKGKFPKLNYYRDIPCNKDIYYAYFLANNYNLVKYKTDFLGALILKWIKAGVVKVEMKDKNGLLKKREEATLIMDLEKFQKNTEIDELETKMFGYMYEASKDGILESKEFSKYSDVHYSKILNWFDKVLKKEKETAVSLGLIKMEKKLLARYYETIEIYDEATKLAGLKKFLKDFSSIKDKSSIEVHLWEYYLIFAQIFGIADQVAKDFKKLYPEVITDFSHENLVIVHTMSRNSIRSATSARSRAQSYSSGGGGSSSSGGGGGSSGGGGGGGGFR